MMTKKLLGAMIGAAVLLPGLAQAQDWRTVTMSRQLEGREEVKVEIDYGAGHFTVRSIDEGLLYRMNLEYDEDKFEPVAEVSGDRVRLGVETRGRNINLGRRNAGSLDLELVREVPMDLEINLGAVQAAIDLGGLALTDLDMSTGASESTVTISEPNSRSMSTAGFAVGAAEFSVSGLGNLNAERIEVDAGVGSITLGLDGEWRQDARLSIDMGLGSLRIVVPEGLGIRLRKDSFLTSLDSEGLIKRGDVYESPDFDEAAHRVSIDLDAAFGSVSIVWINQAPQD
jgi:hypothetical protein